MPAEEQVAGPPDAGMPATHPAGNLRTIGPRIPHGASLQQFLQRGEAAAAVEIAARAALVRPEPFYEDPLEPGVAMFPAEFQDRSRRRSLTGPVTLVCLEGVTVLGRDGLCVHRGRLILNSMQSIEPWRRESLIAKQDDQGCLVLKQAMEVSPPASSPLMLGFVGAWPNYAHWITECLPRAVAFLALREREPDAKLLLPPLANNSPQLAILRRLGIGPDATSMLGAAEAIEIRRFWALNGIAIWQPATLCRAAALRLSMAVPLDVREAEGSLPERVYIQRGMPNRRLVNFDAIKPVLDRFGFTVMRMQELSPDDQVRVMRNARFVVGENSGGLANIMFCRRGMRLLELNNPAFAQPAHWALTGLIGADYGYCVGRHAGAGAPGMNSDYTIAPDQLASALEALVADDRAPRRYLPSRAAGASDTSSPLAHARLEGSAPVAVIDSLTEQSEAVPASLFAERHLTRKVVAPAMPLAQLRPVLLSQPEFIDEWVPDFHSRQHERTPYEVSCYFAADAVVSGRGHIFVGGSLVMSPQLMPPYWRKWVGENPQTIEAERSLPLRTIERPTVIFSAWGVHVYGHFLIEMLPRLIVARRALGPAFNDWALLLEQGTPAWFMKILTEFFRIDPARLEFFDSQKEAVQLRYAAIPTLTTFDDFFHQFTNDIFEEIVDQALPAGAGVGAPRLMISRALFSNPFSHNRRCENELRLAEIAAREFDFSVVANETLPWATQIALFSSAKVIVGEYGSGLHNAIFAPAGTRVGAIGINAITQSAIGAVRGHQNAYLRAPRDPGGFFAVDEDLFRRFLAEVTKS